MFTRRRAYSIDYFIFTFKELAKTIWWEMIASQLNIRGIMMMNSENCWKLYSILGGLFSTEEICVFEIEIVQMTIETQSMHVCVSCCRIWRTSSAICNFWQSRSKHNTRSVLSDMYVSSTWAVWRRRLLILRAMNNNMEEREKHTVSFFFRWQKKTFPFAAVFRKANKGKQRHCGDYGHRFFSLFILRVSHCNEKKREVKDAFHNSTFMFSCGCHVSFFADLKFLRCPHKKHFFDFLFFREQSTNSHFCRPQLKSHAIRPLEMYDEVLAHSENFKLSLHN